MIERSSSLVNMMRYTLNGCWVTNVVTRPSVNRFGDCVGGIRALMRAWNLA